MTDGARLLTVQHTTVYRYSEPVGLGEHRMMFRPRESHDLRLMRTKLDILPHPAQLRWLHDVFDNSVAIATFGRTTTELLRFDSTVTLEHLETVLPDYALEIEAQTYPFSYPDEDGPDLVRARIRHYPGDEVSSWAARFLSPAGSTDTMALLQAMTSSIRHEFSYVRRPEKGVQRPEDTLRLRSGSCRDFALFMMEAVRSLGIAARFVSGYIFVPDTDEATTVSGGATHAWMQVYLPGAGWVDFDPTNSVVGNRNLIRVAVAWDHGQALPLWGTFIGSASSYLGMDVTVSVTEAARPTAVP
ncbi:MAG TPA: transglutaminase family protein [Vicinamibacterales bacterium]|nr:transglutaminase family protein [Vicinamibacterales bacterium]